MFDTIDGYAIDSDSDLNGYDSFLLAQADYDGFDADHYDYN